MENVIYKVTKTHLVTFTITLNLIAFFECSYLTKKANRIHLQVKITTVITGPEPFDEISGGKCIGRLYKDRLELTSRLKIGDACTVLRTTCEVWSIKWSQLLVGGPVAKREARGAEAPGGEVGRLPKASRHLQVSGHNRWSVLCAALLPSLSWRGPSTVDTLTLHRFTKLD